jgi:hypothetical protein
MKKILWIVGGASEFRFLHKIASVLERYCELESIYITELEETYKLMSERGVNGKFVGDIVSMYKDTNQPLTERVEICNGILKDIDLRMFLHGDDLIRLFAESRSAKEWTVDVVIAISNFLNEVRPHYCLGYATGSVYVRALMHVGPEYSMASYILTYASIFSRMGLMPAGKEFRWTWKKLEDAKLNGEQPTIQKNLKSTIRSDEFIENYFKAHKSRPLVKRVGFVSSLAKLLIKSLYLPLMLKAKKNIDLGEFARRYDFMVSYRKTRWHVSSRFFGYDETPSARSYVYMPLASSDVVHRVWNPMNFLQEFHIQLAINSLPSNIELVIKEHPYGLGDIPHSTLRKFQKLGVKVVSPKTHSLELVKNAAAVICLGETTGWESVLLKTPVVVFCADAFYDYCPGVFKVKDPNLLHRAILKAVRFETNDELERARESAIEEIINCTNNGNVWGYKNVIWIDANTNSENVLDIANAIAEGLELCGSQALQLQSK